MTNPAPPRAPLRRVFARGGRACWPRLLLGLWLLLPGWLAAEPWEAERALQVEAAYLVNFLRYAEWPAQAFADPQAPFRLVVVAPPSVARVIAAVAEAAGSVQQRPLLVTRLRPPRDGRPTAAQLAQIADSHLLYLHAEGDDPRPLLEALRGHPVLTVGRGEHFAAAGGMFGLVRADQRIRFEANSEAIGAAGLRVSAKVLKLARRDHRLPP